MDFNKFFQSKPFKGVLIGLGAFIILILVFWLGLTVGFKKAGFSYRWAESYHKNFGGPRGGFFGDWQKFLPPAGDFIEGHGAFGEIIKINDSDLVVKGKGDVEKVIVLAEKTILEAGRKTIKKGELKVGDRVVIIGSPNEAGQIEAKLVRVMPPPSDFRPSRDIFPNRGIQINSNATGSVK